jgi:hypothetical protein
MQFFNNTHGNLPSRAWGITGAGPSATACHVWELLLPEKILSEQLESLYAKPFGGYTP